MAIDNVTLERIDEIVQPGDINAAVNYDAAIPAIAEQQQAGRGHLPSPRAGSAQAGTGLQRLGDENTSDVMGRPLLLSSSTNGSRSPRLRAITLSM